MRKSILVPTYAKSLWFTFVVFFLLFLILFLIRNAIEVSLMCLYLYLLFDTTVFRPPYTERAQIKISISIFNTQVSWYERYLRYVIASFAKLYNRMRMRCVCISHMKRDNNMCDLCCVCVFGP